MAKTVSEDLEIAKLNLEYVTTLAGNLRTELEEGSEFPDIELPAGEATTAGGASLTTLEVLQSVVAKLVTYAGDAREAATTLQGD